MTKQASSSSLFTEAWTYHVFLSFRGVDTRLGFTNNLHQGLVRKGIRSFIDREKLQVGEEISPTLAKAIEESRIGIIVFSENYASSTFCLEELVQILKCIKGMGHLVWPIFYKVDPCNVRHQIESYKEAFDKLEKRFGNNSPKIIKWKAALHEVANLKGEHFTRNEYEHDFIDRIIQKVSRLINRKPLYISANYLVDLKQNEYEHDFIDRIIQKVSRLINRKPLYISANYLVDLKPRVQKVLSLLTIECYDAKFMVGICGIGGIGKSITARAVFNLIADQFESLCFLADVKENSIGNRGLVQLQHTLLLEILGKEDMNFIDVHKGSEIIKDRLQQKKVLLVLDDIDKLKQLRTLVGGLNWFGSGSRIIITTRDKHLLRVHGVERIYEVEGLKDAEAYKLFCWNAFKKNKVDSSHMNISIRAVRYCKGLPLALDIIGCNFFGKDIVECESALDSYERNPNKEIQEILKVSYDGLEENEKIIFLDIACFFKGYVLGDVKNILRNSRGFDPEYVISVLAEKSLINIDPVENILSMHDLIRDMGRAIVRQESNMKPGEWSRLWYYEDILEVLQENKGTDKTEFLLLDLPNDEEVEWDGEAFKDMKNLRVLIIKSARFSERPKYLPNSLRILDWTGYPSSSLPQDFCPRKLVMLSLPNCVLALDKTFQKFKSLTYMDLSSNRFLRQVPDISGIPNLRRLCVRGCINLIEVHNSIGHHDRIRELYVAGCSKLSIFPQSMKSSADHSHIDFSDCLSLPSFPRFAANDLFVNVDDDSYGHSSLSLSGSLHFAQLNTGIFMFSKLHRFKSGSGEGSSKITCLMLQNCQRIDEVLTTNFSWFSTLEVLKLHHNILTEEFFFTRLPWFPNLTTLDLTANDFTTLPACINQCSILRRLVLDKCYQLREIRGIPSSVKHLSAISCKSLTSQSLSLLCSEKLHEGGGTKFLLPGSRIPNWFNLSCKGSSLSFWFRKKFPLVALCLVYWADFSNSFYDFTIQVHVNRQKISSQSFPNMVNTSVEHVYLFDLQNTSQSLRLDDQVVKEYTEDGWNHVEFKLGGYLANVEWMGVYIYKQNHDPEDVQFTSPIIH